jgi:hypothetical protein
MIVNTNASLTQEMLESAREHFKNQPFVGQADVFLVNHSLYHYMLEEVKWERWLKTLPKHKQRQERLKEEIKGRLGRYKKRSLPV